MTTLAEWLQTHALGQYEEVLTENGIDLEIVVDLSEADLADLGLSLGDRKRMLRAINALRTEEPAGLSETPAPFHAEDDGVHGNGQELRQMTLMFVDLVGSTSMANEMDIEDYRECLHIYQKVCLEAIRARHGYVAQFLGDGVVAYFGYPSADEADAERAVLAGLAICQSVRELDTPNGQTLQVRVGIATGDVLVENLADAPQISTGLALGETPNLAARLQSAAAPGAVAISDATRRLLGSNFHCDNLGALAFKGFAKPVQAWIVRSFEDVPLRFLGRQNPGTTPLVDRQDELYVLESRWRAACRGEGHAVFLSGEAGIGKSRLAHAVGERVAGADTVVLSLQCSPYRDASALYPVISLITHSAQLSRTESPKQSLDKLEALLRDWIQPDPETLALLAGLLLLPNDGRLPELDLDADAIRARTFQVLLEIMTSLSRRGPLLVIFEDLHWIDPTTEDLLESWIEALVELPVLLVGTFRPEYRSRWEGQPRVTTMVLGKLDGRQSEQMVEHLVKATGKMLSEDIRQQIIARTEGVPLFVEEMVRMVQRRMSGPEALTGYDASLALPSTLKDLLRARIDSLVSARDIVPICAAMGRVVHPGILQVVSGVPEGELTALLLHLVEAQILVPHGHGTELRYHFRHALIQDAAYEAMLPRRARQLHTRVAEVLRNDFAVLAADNPEILAIHYTRAGQAEQAREAWRDAASRAAARSATVETIQHLRAALTANDQIEGEDRTLPEIELRKELNVALERRAFGSPEFQQNFDRLDELFRATSDGTLPAADKFLSLHGAFGTQLLLAHPKQALEYCAQMSEIAASGEGDATMRTLAEHNLGMARFMLGDFAVSVGHFDLALSHREQATTEEMFRLHAADTRPVDLAMRCWARALDTGDTPELRDALVTCTTEVRKNEHIFSQCYGLAILATAYQSIGTAADALSLAGEVRKISDETEFDYWAAWSGIVAGWSVARLGSPEDGVGQIQQGLEAYRATGSRQIVPYALTLLADAQRMRGQMSAARAAIVEARAMEETSSVRFQAAMTASVEAKLGGAAD